MKHTKNNCTAGNLFISDKGLQCGNCLAYEEKENKPEYGKQYALTGGKDDKCIMNGNTWDESEVKTTLVEDRTWDKTNPRVIKHFTGTENECLEWIHKHTPFSVHEAFINQGYKLIKKQI